MAFRSVTAYAPEGVATFGLGLIGEIFSGRFAFDVCAERPGPVRTDLGLTVQVDAGLDRLAAADLVIALPGSRFREPPPAVADAFRAAAARGATVASHCVGAYVLAEAGLLDGRRATTHWRFAAEFAEHYPTVRLATDVLYVDEGPVVTGAGAAAGVDMCLHLIRREFGSAAANDVARELVVPPHRDGGQAQFVTAPVPDGFEDQRLGAVLAWARANTHRRLTVDELAARALTSRRTFLRRFADATGTTPHAWLLAQRLNRAEELLEASDLPVEEVARQVGFGSAAALREQFVRRRGVPPRTYRNTFGRRSTA
ncbi:helix-turn-helix domain-containing protein [Catellatospora chokoriensis]|uniref:helix-turn-helix domain-containing protein n=1 Tax=Catellatospora chokoriensis TaxID=310353 RepID=UPI001EF224CD|nr:helix-turn-helix domain-containing protein [Catellatospora chokoriensis]